jgi:hypothetical protein
MSSMVSSRNEPFSARFRVVSMIRFRAFRRRSRGVPAVVFFRVDFVRGAAGIEAILLFLT